MPFLATSHKSQQDVDGEVPASTTVSSSNKLKDFEAVFPKLVKDLEEHAKQYNIPEEALKWYSNVCFLALSTVPSPAPTLPDAIILSRC